MHAAKATCALRRLLVGVLALGVAFLALTPSPALATQPALGEIEAPGAEPFHQLDSESAAVDSQNGHILVADSGNGLVYDFASSADPAPEVWSGSTTPKGSFGGGRIAVAADNSSGDVYVADATDAVIDKLDQEGNLIASFGDSEPLADGQLAGITTPAASFSPAATGTFGIAVDQATGDLYAIDAGHQVIDVFDSSGVYLEQIAAAPGELYGGAGAYTDGIAVDNESGELLVSTSWDLKTYRFDLASGIFIAAIDGSETPAGSFGNGYTSVAVDSDSGDIYINDTADSVVDRFDSSPLYQDQISGLPGGSFGGLAVDQLGGELYVSDGSTQTVKVFGPPPPTQTLTVAKTGSGAGNVASAPLGIDCGHACAAQFEEGATVVLTATPLTGSAFAGWTGACTGSGSCEVTLGEALSVGAEFAFAGANPGGCPNEALRQGSLLNSATGLPYDLQLPECRAYERVTPSFENGVGGAGVIAAAADEPRLLVNATNTFAGAESNTLGPTYELSRGSGGWEAAALNPPASLYTARLFDTASADLSKSLWSLRAGSQSVLGQALYLRQPSGAFVRVGPMSPPAAETAPPARLRLLVGAYEYVGASADLSHSYFQIVNGRENTSLWPGDTTGPFPDVNGNSLYEYVGVGNSEPNLVGVDAGANLISDCATYLGGDESNDTFNAVSGDGSTTYFTAEGHSVPSCAEANSAPEVSELYARLHGSESVPISEPRPADCADCLTTTRAAAEFRGASADGSKVFFTTAQELLPGDQGTNLYEFDFDAPAGQRIIRASASNTDPIPEVQGVVRVSADGSHVYFVARARLTSEPRGGTDGPCLEELSPAERAAEEATEEGRCRPLAGADNLYVFEPDSSDPAGRVAFIATLAAADESSWVVPDNHPAQSTPDGDFLALQSSGALTPDVGGEAPQVYEYGAEEEELVRVSRGQRGYPQGTANANTSYAVMPSPGYLRTQKPTAQNTSLALSRSGGTVEFASPAALSPDAERAAEAGAESIYEFRSAGPLAQGDVFLLSGGQNAESAVQQGLTQSGEDAFFRLSQPLVGSDRDGKVDIYDARVGGGFVENEPSSCSGEACLEPAPAPPPQPPAPASLLAQSPAAKSGQALTKALKRCRQKRRASARRTCERHARHRSAHLKKAKHGSATTPKGGK